MVQSLMAAASTVDETLLSGACVDVVEMAVQVERTISGELPSDTVEKALVTACSLEARLRLYSVWQEEAHNYALSQTLAESGLLDPNDIILTSADLEKAAPGLYILFQVRILLVLGSTAASSNVNETSQEELEILLDELKNLDDSSLELALE